MTDHNTGTVADAIRIASEAFAAGAQPIPLPHGEKRPRGVTGWTSMKSENLEDLQSTFQRWGDKGYTNVGVLLGEPSDGLIDIDLDHESAMRLRDYFLPPTPMRSGRGARPDSHFWYRAKPGTLPASRPFKLSDRQTVSVEIRSTGGQTVLPGSTHPNGDKYTWSSDPWGGEHGPAEVDGRVLAVQVALLALGAVLIEKWSVVGSRHAAYLALAGGLLRVGDSGVHPFWARNAEVLIGAMADATHDEDGAESRIAETVDSTIRRLHEGKSVQGFNTLADYLGQDVVKQVRVLVAEVEAAAGVPSRTSGSLTLESLEQSVGNLPANAHSHTEDEHAAAIEAAERALAEAREAAQVSAESESSSRPRSASDPLEGRITTWDAVNLDPYLDGTVQPVEPTIMDRLDGKSMLYPGRLNMIYGPSESAKSWIAMATCVQMMGAGERIFYMDFEDEPVNSLSRMMLLGAQRDDLRTLFSYLRPEEPLSPMLKTRWGDLIPNEKAEKAHQSLLEQLDRLDPAMVVVDGMTMLYGLHGLDTNDTVQTDTITTWLKQLTRNGRTTVLVIDHTAKNPARGSLPIGSQHKVSMVQGAMLQAYPVSQPMPGAIGRIDLIVLKDRPGKVRQIAEKTGEKAQLVAKVVMDSTEPGKTKLTFEAPGSGGDPSPTTPGQLEVDMRHSEAAAKAEREHRENRMVLNIFGGDMDRHMTTAQITEILFPQSATQPSQKWGSRTRAILKRLVEQGWVAPQGARSDRVWVLQVGQEADPIELDDLEDVD